MIIKELQIPCVGYSINADWYEGETTDEILLVLIAWNSTRAKYQDITEHMVKSTGMSALVVEYAGFGESPFDVMNIRPVQHFLDAITAFDWLKEQHPNSRISVMGTSYGGYMATQLTKYRDFDNLVLRVPAIYIPKDFYALNKDINRRDERTYRQDKEMLNTHPLFNRASKFKGRTLVVVHEFDESIPKETTDKYIEMFKADTYLAKGFKHSFNVNAPADDKLAYKNAISDWLNVNESGA